jgi:hypothetical protein
MVYPPEPMNDAIYMLRAAPGQKTGHDDVIARDPAPCVRN